MGPLTTLKLYAAGEVTVVALAVRDAVDTINLGRCRDELIELIQSTKCQLLAFDLTGVRLLPSGLLGLLASVPRLGAEVVLFNPCSDICEILEITKLKQVLPVEHVAVSAE